MKTLKKIIDRLSSPVDTEYGSAIVGAMLVLVLLTIFGMSALTTTDSELKVVSGERDYLQDFFAADSAWRVGARTVDNNALPLRIIDSENGTVKSFDTGVTADGEVNDVPFWYGMDAQSRSVRQPGWTGSFLKYWYALQANGHNTQEIQVGLSKIYQTQINYGQ